MAQPKTRVHWYCDSRRNFCVHEEWEFLDDSNSIVRCEKCHLRGELQKVLPRKPLPGFIELRPGVFAYEGSRYMDRAGNLYVREEGVWWRSEHGNLSLPDGVPPEIRMVAK